MGYFIIFALLFQYFAAKNAYYIYIYIELASAVNARFTYRK